MPGNNDNNFAIWPLFLYAALVVVLLTLILSLSYVLGQHHREKETDLPYEGGIKQTGSARLRFSAQFYLVAMLFVIFDVETVFLFPWAIIYKQLALFGLVEMLVFLGILVVGYVWIIKKGALDWA